MRELLERHPKLLGCEEDIKKALRLIEDTYESGGKLLLCGNGGSATDCEHIVGELMKGFKSMRKVSDERIPEEIRGKLQGSLPAISLPSQSAIISAFCNDISPEMVYAQLVYGYAKPEDLVIGISTSGNSVNVLKAVELAKCIGVKSIAMTGKGGGELSEIATVSIKVPETETYKVQELHLPVYHYLCAEIERMFFENDGQESK
ncbi:MAG: SIS domain-containing protein [Oscillospiraceae bacterium]|nr:SIS domain-containing protein [Oscillospiraceae bacterium]